ncbi:hypothetical protein A6V27_09360 [Hafnia alvei]|nr:hypothetical protein A6V27_09360 [Hafnia alvei]
MVLSRRVIEVFLIFRGLYPSYFKRLMRWLRSITRITYQSQFIGILSLAAFKQLELFWAYLGKKKAVTQEATTRPSETF